MDVIRDEDQAGFSESFAEAYGLSDPIVDRLLEAGINTVRDRYEAEEERLDAIPYIGQFRVRRLKNAVAQAISL